MHITFQNRLLPLLLLCCCLGWATASQAQITTKSGSASRKEKEEKLPFKQRLWYGGGLNLGFSAFNNTRAFGIGVSPMVGYKFTNWLSAGPRVSVFFTSQKYQGYKAVNLFDTEAGAFLRIRAYRGLFLQGEISSQWYQYPSDPQPGSTTLGKVTQQRPAQYIGAGYNFANGMGGPGSEISIFYNIALANDINAYQDPLGYRFAFTWNF
ncbi:MAG TPA: hypothetical protein PK971_16170 [Saprospiraceae bacterium]|nr:hypothetical protein [Saprospiraceae bacterium]HNG88716.1 hypothetical protein [Saprospiraceae bacterium]